MDERGASIEVVYADPHVVEVAVSARGERFSGAALAYAGRGELLEIAERLTGFPADPKDAREFTLGGFGGGWAGGAARFRFYCVDGAGHAFAEVSLEAEEGRGGVCEAVRLALPVEPAAVDEFVSQLRAVGRTLRGAAFLRATF